MKPYIALLSLIVSFQCFAQAPEKDKPEKLADHTKKLNFDQNPRAVVQAQLEAYNSKDLEAFLNVFAEDAEAYNYGEAEAFITGKPEFRRIYGNLFDASPALYSEVISRQVIGNTVIDYEYITGRQGNAQPLLLVAMYVVEDGKIVRCEFMRE
ncbi:nuclear transport factor 2 family protein [Psychroflexus sediminis]|uniref:SnoaL-like domain-containing protein n=1 Tax=Psychroflexus sediminis TaxID=470826 RepID=A0A1G7V7I1_9FLAO|nr:nuclear transport factor 2 family protein [Psychroflexus sediminis]SDG55723.1 hypothetical protein SAMN04488027_103131 [Psychroflexus sediminis]